MGLLLWRLILSFPGLGTGYTLAIFQGLGKYCNWMQALSM